MVNMENLDFMLTLRLDIVPPLDLANPNIKI